MERVPNSRLLLKNSAFAKGGIALMAYARLQRLGFDMSRVMFEEATRDYMERYLDVDIALDTYPWPGGGTTCDALYMGVPVVTRYGERRSTRFSYALKPCLELLLFALAHRLHRRLRLALFLCHTACLPAY